MLMWIGRPRGGCKNLMMMQVLRMLEHTLDRIGGRTAYVVPRGPPCSPTLTSYHPSTILRRNHICGSIRYIQSCHVVFHLYKAMYPPAWQSSYTTCRSVNGFQIAAEENGNDLETLKMLTGIRASNLLLHCLHHLISSHNISRLSASKSASNFTHISLDKVPSTNSLLQ
jgi:hypothetical protein